MAEDNTDLQTSDAEMPAELLEQTVTIEDSGPARKLLKFELPASRITDKTEDTFGKLMSESALPGFRPGRAPRRLVERRFGSNVRDDVRAQLISESFSQAVEENGLDVIGEPDVKDHADLKLPEEGPFLFEIEVEVAPEVTLPDFSSLKVTRNAFAIADEDVDKELRNMQTNMGRPGEIADGVLADEDYAQVQVNIFAGENAGDDAEEIAAIEETYIYVRDKEDDKRGHIMGILVEDMGVQLAGKKAGDEIRISMTGPENHEEEKIKGQPITIAVVVRKVERIEPATVTDVVAQYGAEDEADLRHRVYHNIEQMRENEQISDMNNQILTQLMEQVELELPVGMTGRQTSRVLQRSAFEMSRQGATRQDIEQHVAEMRSGSEEEARRQLKQFFIIDKAAKDFEVEVEDSEILGHVAYLAQQRGRRPEKLRQEMSQSGELEHLYLSIREMKTLESIREKTTIEDVGEQGEHHHHDHGDDKKEDAAE